MKHNLYIYILIFLASVSFSATAQDKNGSSRFSRKGIASNLASAPQEIPDSLLIPDSAMLKSKPIIAYRLADLGEPYIAPMDTERMNYGATTLVEAQSLAIGYLSNLGSPAQSKIFADRKEARDFTYADPYDYYITTPTNAKFYDSKIPYTNVTYSQAGAGTSREDDLKGILTWNIGKKINLGAEMDYIYGRGQYQSNGTKLLNYRFFGSYRTDRYELNAHIYNFNFVNYENGGLANDKYITNPEDFAVGRQQVPRAEYPVRFTNVWNRVRGKQYFLAHRYNLGFTRTIEPKDTAEQATTEIFIPVSSIIHTFTYEDFFRRFTATDNNTPNIDNAYLRPTDPNTSFDPNRQRLTNIFGIDQNLNDAASSWQASNTVALSLREGFQDWAKFGLAAFARIENRQFKLPATIPGLIYDETNGTGPNPQPDNLDYDPNATHNEFSTYIGANLSKQQGTILTYNAHGELCMAGSDIGEFRLAASLRTTFPVFGKQAAISANGYIRNVTPPFFQRMHHSRYFWWDNTTRPLSKTRQFRAEGQIEWDYTNTTVTVSAENLQNHIYFNQQAMPEQHNGHIQILTARIQQNFYHRALGWENSITYQLSSQPDILPLPQLAAFTNIYVHTKLARVLTIQLGVNAWYHTRYYAPYYEPATQQFILQDQTPVGHYPLVNAYVNFHLKQARFFAMLYNASSAIISEPAYFSLQHYPLNPMLLKLGVAVTFRN
ncbi:MAG: putative porin [Tannerellaceae bacterium]|jgi:hypothetical protein|nr:putative porin [Tannerellaceae bacterium]